MISPSVLRQSLLTKELHKVLARIQKGFDASQKLILYDPKETLLTTAIALNRCLKTVLGSPLAYAINRLSLRKHRL